MDRDQHMLRGKVFHPGTLKQVWFASIGIGQAKCINMLSIWVNESVNILHMPLREGNTCPIGLTHGRDGIKGTVDEPGTSVESNRPGNEDATHARSKMKEPMATIPPALEAASKSLIGTSCHPLVC